MTYDYTHASYAISARLIQTHTFNQVPYSPNRSDISCIEYDGYLQFASLLDHSLCYVILNVIQEELRERMQFESPQS
jgi:hypothetical protein